MLDHPNIKIMLNVDFREIEDEVRYDRLIYTGPIDEFFDFRFGKPIAHCGSAMRRSTGLFQPVAVVNYPSTRWRTRASPSTST